MPNPICIDHKPKNFNIFSFDQHYFANINNDNYLLMELRDIIYSLSLFFRKEMTFLLTFDLNFLALHQFFQTLFNSDIN
jgi:hypothetical protein